MASASVFKARGLELDTRLMVLGQEYHVHSAISKMKSVFFFKFMDSPDKISGSNTTPREGNFKYEWVTCVEEDGSWSLVAAGSEQARISCSFDLVDRSQSDAFDNLLCAMYDEPYSIYLFELLEPLVQLADYYCALPALSRTLTNALMAGDFEVRLCDAVSTAELALKVRNGPLFRDCIVRLAGHYHRKDMDLFRDVASEKLRKAVGQGINSINEQIVNCQSMILQISTEYPDIKEAIEAIKLVGGEGLPEYYRKVACVLETSTGFSVLTNGLEIQQLLSNVLKFRGPLPYMSDLDH